MSRFFAPKENIKGNNIYIGGREAKHILNVMRLKENDNVVVFDGTGKEYSGFIKEIKIKSLIVEVISTKTPKKEGLPEIMLVQAVPKKEKMDFIVEKATELGISSIAPVITERTVVSLEGDKAFDKVERWRKIALEATKQCGRADVPEIKNVQKFYNFIYNKNDADLTLMACLGEDTINFRQAISDFKRGKITFFIGPEGDFTPDEIKMAENSANCKFISLGRRVLKSDTAGLYVLSVLNYELSK